MVGARSGWGSVWLLLLWGSVGLLWVVFLEGEGEQKEAWEAIEGEGGNLGVSGFWSNLKGGPVHVHPRPVVVAEPLQILLCVCSQDCALQLSVYCGIAEERKIEQIVRI